MPRTPSDHVDDPALVGKRLREARARGGLSQRQLAFSKCTPAYISRIEAGARIPSLQILDELGKRLGVSAAYLARGEHGGGRDDAIAEAEMALRFDDPATARTKFAAVAEAAADEWTRARALAGLGQVAFEAGDHEAAIDQFELALELAPKLEDDGTLAESLGKAYAFTSQYPQAIALFERRLTAAEERHDLIERIRFSVLLANTLADRGDFARAEQLVAQALNLAERSRDPLTRARLWWTQSRLHVLQNDPERAERYARLALDALTLSEHVRYLAFAHQTLAHIKLDQGQADEALDFLERGFPLVLEGGNAFEQGLFRVEQARALVALDRVDEAEDCVGRALQLLEGGSVGDASRALLVRAEILERRGDSEAAIDCYRRAAEDAPPSARYKREAFTQLAELLRRAGRLEEAYEALSQAVVYADPVPR